MASSHTGTVGFLKEHLEYLEGLPDGGNDPLNDLEGFGNMARYIERAMSGPWANAHTGTIELQESDHATPATVGLLKEYLDYLGGLPNGEGDPFNYPEDFGSLANIWLFGNFLQRENIKLPDGDMFNAGWEVLENQPAFDKLWGLMIVLFVASDAFREKESRHAMMAARARPPLLIPSFVLPVPYRVPILLCCPVLTALLRSLAPLARPLTA